MNDQVLRPRPIAIGAAEFFRRSRARLDFDVPPGLVDPNIIPKTGDEGNDRMLEIVAREQPVRPAAVLIPVVDHPQPTVLLTQRSPHLSSHKFRCLLHIRLVFSQGADTGDAKQILQLGQKSLLIAASIIHCRGSHG